MKKINEKTGSTTGLMMLGVALVCLAILCLVLFDVTKIAGNQMGVKETWSGGVIDQAYPPKTYFLFPGFTQEMYSYDMGVQVYVMNDKDGSEEYAEGRKTDAYLVQSKDQQDMTVSLRVQWRRKAETLVQLHKSVRNNVEERIIRPVLLNVVKNQATLRTALEAYSGEGLVSLQSDILRELKGSQELNQYIEVEGFVIEHIGLNKEYTDQIVARQVAVQKKLRADEETKAALADAEKAKAVAQADYEKTVVEAERDKRRGILEAEKLAQQQVLRAEADAKKIGFEAQAERDRNVLIAQGEKEAAINRAEAILALGKAEAEAKKMQLSAYAVPGAESFVRIQVAESMSEAFKNVKGYLPEGMSINLLAEQYEKGVGILVGSGN